VECERISRQQKEEFLTLVHLPITKLFNSFGALEYANSRLGTDAKISDIAMRMYAGICQRMEISLGRYDPRLPSGAEGDGGMKASGQFEGEV
jgi:hypothetical protein